LDKARILIVDDDPNILLTLEKTLLREGHLVEKAPNGAEAIQKIRQAPFDLLLLDLNMKPVTGLQVLHAVREHDPDIIVIIFTAHSSLDSAVEALRLGAFDYIYKPASPDVIRQRVSQGLESRRKALDRTRLMTQIEGLRQSLVDLDLGTSHASTDSSPLRFLRHGELIIDKYHRSATLGEKLLDLTTTEFDLLVALVEAAPEPVSPRHLVTSILNYNAEEAEASEIIKSHIYHLRQKIESDVSKPQYIKTIRFKGYLWSSGT
jgi:two-component system, OmpR family, alkaline phosphatase synthesis response regulator PhoP